MILDRYNVPGKFPLFARSGMAQHWETLKGWINRINLNLNPPYQRGYVWNKKQKIAYIEYMLKGGLQGREIVINFPDHGKTENNECIDGQQRLKSVLEFINGKYKVFNNQYGFENLHQGLLNECYFLVNEYCFKDQKEVVNVYIGMNTGGSIHTKEDIEVAEKYLKSLK